MRCPDERSACSCDNIESAQSDDSDVDSDRDIDKPPLHIQLAQWAARHSVTQNAVGSLLSILKPYHPSLPSDPRTLRNTPQSYELKVAFGIDGQAGHYSHFGIEKGLTDLLQEQSLLVE